MGHTWKIRPSGEYVLAERSYPVPMEVMVVSLRTRPPPTPDPMASAAHSPTRAASASPSAPTPSNSTRTRSILIPTTHDLPHVPRRPSPIRRAKSNSSSVTSKLIKNAKGTLPDSPSSSSLVAQTPDPWWTLLGKFRYAGQRELEGYQIYAVQKWYPASLLMRIPTHSYQGLSSDD
jgi:hypothetical protein